SHPAGLGIRQGRRRSLEWRQARGVAAETAPQRGQERFGHHSGRPRAVILYLDTSSLIKLYIEEPGTPEVYLQIATTSLVCTSVIATAEPRGASARLCREGSLSPEEHARTKTDLDKDWKHYLMIDATPEVWRAAGDLAEAHALRGCDSIHLASFLHL